MMFINGFGLSGNNDALMNKLAESLSVIKPGQPLIGTELKKQLKNCGAFVAAGVRASAEAIFDSGMTEEGLGEAGIIVTSRIGDQNTTSEFIDELIDYGADQGSPLKFAHSVHNAAASYIAKEFNIYGPSVTTVDFEESFLNGLILAQCWLNQGTCSNVLLLQIESCSPLTQVLINYACASTPVILREINDTLIFADSKAECVASCFLLGSKLLKPGSSFRFSFLGSRENNLIPQKPLPIETPLPDPVRLLSAMINAQERELLSVNGTACVIEKA